MTFEQAKLKLDKDKECIYQALDSLQTAKALFAVGEDDKAVNLYAAVRRMVRLQLNEE